jgi:uncharacterized protein (DUF342 family)
LLYNLYIRYRKLVIENVKSEYYKWLAEMAKALDFKVVEVELSEDEEDAALLAAMEKVKDEPIATEEEVLEFEAWLKANK